jgi:hypothetical protein
VHKIVEELEAALEQFLIDEFCRSGRYRNKAKKKFRSAAFFIAGRDETVLSRIC